MVAVAEERGGLIPGLPEELVVAHVVPRLPWYARPVCRVISTSWRAWIDTCKKQQWAKEHELKTRKYQLPLLTGLFLICTYDTQLFITRDRVAHDDDETPRATYTAVRGSYQIHRQWRRLPPLPGLLPLPVALSTLIASSGMVYVWSHEEPNFVLKLDLGCGDWTWNKFPIPHPFNANAVVFNDKIYVPRISAACQKVLVYDMMTDECELVETWNHDNLRVLRNKSSRTASHVEEQMYSFVEHELMSNSKLELLVYDKCGDSWRSEEEIPFPEWKWSELPEVKLLNGDCFEPDSEMDVNTVWIDYENEVISWFRSSIRETWVTIELNSFLEGKALEYLQFIQGWLYGIFCEDKQDQGDEEEENKDSEEEEVVGGEQDPRLFKRTIMKGKICVASSIVVWEEIEEAGCFDQVIPTAASPIDLYTLMT